MSIKLDSISPDFLAKEIITESEVYGNSVRFEKGKRYLIKAPSGKGKSTLMNILYGIQAHYSGSVSGASEGRKTLSYVFQDLKLFPELSALDNVRIKNDLSGHKTVPEIKEMLERVGLGPQIEQRAASLSFGQRQRVAVVRALCMPFDFLLLDEPFSHLDDANSKVMTRMIDEELAAQNAGLIIAMLDDSHHFNYDAILNL